IGYLDVKYVDTDAVGRLMVRLIDGTSVGLLTSTAARANLENCLRSALGHFERRLGSRPNGTAVRRGRDQRSAAGDLDDLVSLLRNPTAPKALRMSAAYELALCAPLEASMVLASLRCGVVDLDELADVEEAAREGSAYGAARGGSNGSF
ncbi:MAG TPA: hypothetical protein VGM56_09775, partial [Byssovorax sp.]